MSQQLHIKICAIIILHQHIAWSYRVHHLDGDADSDLLPKLRQILQGYEIPNYAEARPRQDRHRFKPVGKSMFVKRFIPHGYKTGKYEYDSRLNTVYKPLYRYQINNHVDDLERSAVRIMPAKPKKTRTIEELIEYVKKNYSGALLKKLLENIAKNFFKEFSVGRSMFVKRFIPHEDKTGKYEYDSPLNTGYKSLYHITNPEDDLESSAVRIRPAKLKNTSTIKDLIAYLTKKYSGLLLKKLLDNIAKDVIKGVIPWRYDVSFDLMLKNNGHPLRDMDNSKEQDDPLAPGKIPENLVDVVVENSKETVTLPYYPFWNYWTYQKTVVEDACPGNLVKLGNMCISPIGHRRDLRRAGTIRRANKHKPRKLRYG